MGATLEARGECRYCSFIQYLVTAIMNDDLIDDTGFELGMPTHVEMLQHYNQLLEAELDTPRLTESP